MEKNILQSRTSCSLFKLAASFRLYNLSWLQPGTLKLNMARLIKDLLCFPWCIFMKRWPRPVADQEHLVPVVLLKIGCFKVWQTMCLDWHGTEVMLWACFEYTHILERFKWLVTFFHIWRTSLFVILKLQTRLFYAFTFTQAEKTSLNINNFLFGITCTWIFEANKTWRRAKM